MDSKNTKEYNTNCTIFTLQQEKYGLQYPFTEDDKEDKTNLHLLINTQTTKDIKRKDRVKKPIEPGQLMGHWTILEKKKYHWFLQMFHEHFENKRLRRMDKIFKSMSTFIGTRVADQCRSHHQKLQKKYKTFYHILFNLRLIHYNSLEIEDMTNELNFYNIKSPNKLIDPFPELPPITEIKIQCESYRMMDQNIHYNFFGERQAGFVQQFLVMNS